MPSTATLRLYMDLVSSHQVLEHFRRQITLVPALAGDFVSNEHLKGSMNIL